MKLLVAGASGLVGSAVTRHAAQAGHEVVAVVGRWNAAVPGAARVLARDLSCSAEMETLVRETAPAVIINAAAIAEPAACESAPELAQQLNVELPAALAVAAAHHAVRLLHLSSEQVFDGEHAPYAPADAARPLNLYGRQKLASEQRVLAASADAAVLRIPLLLGNSLTQRRSVHEKLLEAWHAGHVAKLYVDEIRQVCTADSVAHALLGLAPRRELNGIFHWAGAEPISRYELGRRLAQHFGVNEKSIMPMRRDETPAVSAKRARDLSLRTGALARELALQPETLDAALATLARPAWFA